MSKVSVFALVAVLSLGSLSFAKGGDRGGEAKNTRWQDFQGPACRNASPLKTPEKAAQVEVTASGRHNDAPVKRIEEGNKQSGS